MRTAVGIAIYLVLMVNIYCRMRAIDLNEEEWKDRQAVSGMALCVLMFIGLTLLL